MDILLTSAAAFVLLPPGNSSQYHLYRAIQELLNLCVTWPDWNTVQHALDTGEALLATALAYDWLYDVLSVQQRALVVAGIVSKGLAPYKEHIPQRSVFWWVNNSINWNCVCSGGGIAATLATYGDAGAPTWAWTSVLQPLVEGVVPCVAAYHSDGSWDEGPGYWGYASKYNVWMFSALQSALQDPSACGLTAIAGLPLAARFPIYSTGANSLSGLGQLHNWADAGVGPEWTPFASWWGSRSGFNDTVAAVWARMQTHFLGPLSLKKFTWAGYTEALAFYEPGGSVDDIVALPTHKFYDYVNLGIFRGAWNAPKATQTFLSFKGGNSAWNHNHLDLGSFVYDLAGERFAEDMGADSYALPGYFGPQRWSYYRLNSLGHNVLLFGNTSQTITEASITTFNWSTASPAPGALQRGQVSVDGFAIVDLTGAYAKSAGISSARRGFLSLAGTTAVVIVDELVYASAASPPANVTWQLHTRATAVASPSSPLEVQLSRQGESGTVQATLALIKFSTVCPSFAGFHLVDVAKLLPPPFDSATGFTRVDAFIPSPAAHGAACTNLTLALGDPSIVGVLSSGQVRVRPLSMWESDGPVSIAGGREAA